MNAEGLSEQDLKRYTRHIHLDEFGIIGQVKMKRSSVLVIGVGGLGCTSTTLLTRAGIGRIGIIDHDTISVSDLHRQILYPTQDVGRPKVSIARKRLNEMNPDVDIQVYDDLFTEKKGENIVKEYDLVIDGTDNLEARQNINRSCVKLGKPYIFGAVEQFDGQVSVFWKGKGACFACLYPPSKSQQLPKRTAAINVLSPLVTLIGSIQANEAIKIITGMGTPLIGEMLIMNALEMRFHKVLIPKREDCSVCGKLYDRASPGIYFL